jgi:hypothetical protein
LLDAVVDGGLDRQGLGFKLRELKSVVLELDQRPAERFSMLGVANRRVHDPARRGVVRQRLFFGDDRRKTEVAFGATKPVGQVQPQQPRVAELVPVLTIDLMLSGPTFLVRGRFLCQEFGSVPTQFTMLVCFPARALCRKKLGHCYPLNSRTPNLGSGS